MRSLILLFCLSVIAGSAAARTIVLVADSWPPYNNAADAEQRGYVVEIAEAIFAARGDRVEYRLLPWKVAIEETRKGTYDGLIGADSEDGAGFVFPRQEVGTYQLGFFVKKGTSWRFSNNDSLHKVRLGVAEGYGYAEWLHNYIEANRKDYQRVQSVSGEFPLRNNIRKLLDGRIDALTATPSTVYYTAQQMGVREQLQFAGSGGPGRDVFVVFSPAKQDAAQLAAAFDKGLQRLRETGELGKILARYGLSDWR